MNECTVPIFEIEFIHTFPVESVEKTFTGDWISSFVISCFFNNGSEIRTLKGFNLLQYTEPHI